MQIRSDGRGPGDLRQWKLEPQVNPYAEGSCRVTCGKTVVLVTASVEREVPKWMGQSPNKGWVTAEYGMLPRSTHTRCRRESASGKQEGRTIEIQRLIGRALRQAVDLSMLESLTIRMDCDVLCADGGTRSAAITGGWVALMHALRWCELENLVKSGVTVTPIAALSVGKVEDQLVVDLAYEEDSRAAFDLNLVFEGNGGLIEIQGTAEKQPISALEMQELVGMGWRALQPILALQAQAV